MFCFDASSWARGVARRNTVSKHSSVLNHALPLVLLAIHCCAVNAIWINHATPIDLELQSCHCWSRGCFDLTQAREQVGLQDGTPSHNIQLYSIIICCLFCCQYTVVWWTPSGETTLHQLILSFNRAIAEHVLIWRKLVNTWGCKSEHRLTTSTCTQSSSAALFGGN